MAKTKPVKLLSLTLPNKVGQLATVTGLLGDAGVNLLAIRAAESGANAEIVIAVKNPEKGKKALAPLGVELKETDAFCVEMPNKAGRLLKIAGKLAKSGVNLQSVWGTSFTGKTAACIIVASDHAKAAGVLEK
jgi:hypothetical protein